MQAENNGGVLSVARLYDVIDGSGVQAHGSRGPSNGSTDRLCIGHIGLVRLHVGFDELGRHPLHRMAYLAQFPGPAMCFATRFHADQARLELDEKRQHPSTRQLFAQARLAMKIDTMHLKYGLSQIDTECTQLHFGRSFLVADYLHIHFDTLMPFQEGCVHSIKATLKKTSSAFSVFMMLLPAHCRVDWPLRSSNQ